MFCNSNSYGDDKIAETLPWPFWPAGQNNLLIGE